MEPILGVIRDSNKPVAQSRADGLTLSAGAGLVYGIVLHLIGVTYHGTVVWPNLYLSLPLAVVLIDRMQATMRYTWPYTLVSGVLACLWVEMTVGVLTRVSPL
jgi:hypothetical protein